MKGDGWPSITPLGSDGAAAIVAPAFRLAFLWSVDRWTHALEVGDPLQSGVSAFERGEGDDPCRVVSPAYQQLHFQGGDGGPAQALLVGQSGRHHFSAVYSVEGGIDGAVEVSVDVADRFAGGVEALGCTYRVDLSSGDLISANPEGAVWSVGGGRLTFGATEPGSIGLAESGRSATIVQASAGIDPRARTQRLRFHWRWTPPKR